MPISEAPVAPGTVVRVPFSNANAETRQHRPALAIATAGTDARTFLLWVLMITSVENRGCPGDVVIPDHAAAGLPAPSVVRTAKIATIGLDRAEPKGRLAPQTLAAVRAEIATRLEMFLSRDAR